MSEVRLLTRSGPVTATRGFHREAKGPRDVLAKFDALVVVQQLRSDANRPALVALYGLATGVEAYGPARMMDSALVAAIESAIGSGRLVFTKGWGAGGERVSPTAPAQGSAAAVLASAVMGDRGEISFEGRRYRLVETSVPLRAQPSDRFLPVDPAQAKALLARMADQSRTPADRAGWAAVVSMVLEPKPGRGLRLLRYTDSGGGVAAPSAEPASTPSQLRPKIAEDHWIEIEVVYEDGAPFDGNCVVELPGGRVTEGPPDEGGIIRIDGLTAGDCKLRIPDLDAETFAAG